MKNELTLLLPATFFDVVVNGADGASKRLGELCPNADDGLVLLVFLRHFGCIGCSQQVDALVPILDELEALSVAVILIGNGDSQAIDGFVERQRLADHPIHLVTDPTLRAHALAGFERSVWSTIGPRALWADLVAIANGYTSTPRRGDKFQQGGVLLVRERSRIVFRCANRVAPEPISTAVILEAVLANLDAASASSSSRAKSSSPTSLTAAQNGVV